MNELAVVGPDVIRGAAMAGGGVVFGMALSEAILYYQRQRDPRDPWFQIRRLTYMMFIRLGIAAMSVFLIAIMVSRLGDPKLTWRSPAALLVEGLLIYGMRGILKDDETIQDTGASYRVDPTRAQQRKLRKTDHVNLRETR